MKGAEISIGDIELPACLEVADGEIRIAGHRVSLFRIVDEIARGTPPDRLEERFPTIGGRKLDEVIAFVAQHKDAMRRYRDEYQSAFDARFGGMIGAGPSLAELRRRRAAKLSTQDTPIVNGDGPGG